MWSSGFDFPLVIVRSRNSNVRKSSIPFQEKKKLKKWDENNFVFW